MCKCFLPTSNFTRFQTCTLPPLTACRVCFWRFSWLRLSRTLPAVATQAQDNEVAIFGFGVGANVNLTQLAVIAKGTDNIASESDYDNLQSANQMLFEFLNYCKWMFLLMTGFADLLRFVPRGQVKLREVFSLNAPLFFRSISELKITSSFRSARNLKRIWRAFCE